MKGSEPPRWLLIGNSRWHWGWPDPEAETGLRVVHTTPEQPQPETASLLAWAAVGPLPANLLPESRRITIEGVPLRDLPAWLGVDRALAGWLAWQRLGGAVLVADAGTVLSLTWLDGGGRFRGGRLMAGAALQLRAMAAGAAALPSLAPGIAQGDSGLAGDPIAQAWPRTTAASMQAGVLRGLAAAVGAAHRDLSVLQPGCALVVTGGDASALIALSSWPPELKSFTRHEPDLALRALATLRPWRS